MTDNSLEGRKLFNTFLVAMGLEISSADDEHFTWSHVAILELTCSYGTRKFTDLRSSKSDLESLPVWAPVMTDVESSPVSQPLT
jgi:hypothetical protein